MKYLLISASMGGGHHGVAAEIARRARANGDRAEVVDLLDTLPAGTGRLMRAQYRFLLWRLPGRYERIYASFSRPRSAARTVAPVLRLAAPGVRRLLRDRRPDLVVSTFHLAGVLTGRLRRDGLLAVPSAVAITEFAPHQLWLAPGNDAYLCMSEAVRREAARTVGDRAVVAAPFVRPELAARCVDGQRSGPYLVLVSGGSWGYVDGVERTVSRLVATGRYHPLVLCGNNRRLLRHLRRVAGPSYARGWVDDLPGLLRSAYALVDNAGGLTCTEAFRAGVPVVVHAPLPGHGRATAIRLEAEELVSVAGAPAQLPGVLDRLAAGSQLRTRRCARAQSLFGTDGMDLLRRLPDITRRRASPAC